MSRPVDEQLRQLEAEVDHLQVLPAAEVRARGRRRGRRQLAAVMVGVVAVATTAGLVATRAFDRSQPVATAPVGVVDPRPAGPVVPCVLALPSDPSEVRVRLVAGVTATELRERGFTVLTAAGGATKDPTTLRYGPAAIGSAVVLRAGLLDGATMVFDPARADNTIDLTLGPAFARLATPTEMNQALAAAGEPTAPPGC
jgi:LytR cell envelope-related transcriptional attenuator